MLQDFATGTVEQNMVLRATQLRRTLAKLGASFVKIGQALSARPDLLPKPYLEVSQGPRLTITSFDNHSSALHPAVQDCSSVSRHCRFCTSVPLPKSQRSTYSAGSEWACRVLNFVASSTCLPAGLTAEVALWHLQTGHNPPEVTRRLPCRPCPSCKTGWTPSRRPPPWL